MKIKSMMSFKAIVVIFFGFGFLFITQTLMSLYGMNVNSGVYSDRFSALVMQEHN